MIFSVDGSIQKIKLGTKTQTRRPTDRYQVGKTYAIQPGRTKPGIPDGRIEIIEKWQEWNDMPAWMIKKQQALDEGGYTPDEFELLYSRMYPNWRDRWAYQFKFIPSEGGTA